MDDQTQSRPEAVELALRLQDRIRTEGLEPGDRFLSAEDAARAYGIRKSMANHALQILAHRGVIARKPKIGAVVLAGKPSASPLKRVTLITQTDYPKTEGQGEGAVVSGLQSILTGADIQLFPADQAEAGERVAGLVRAALKNRTPSGLIVVRGSPRLQTQVAESGLPAVAFGSVWPGVPLTGINVDNHSIAMQLARELMRRAGGPLVLLRRDRTSPGENDLLQGAIEAATEAKRPLAVIEAPDEARAASWALRARLSGLDGEIGLIAATPTLARAALNHVDDSRVACASIHPVPGHPGLLRCRCDVSFREQGRLLAEILTSPDAPMAQRLLPCSLVRAPTR